MRISPTAIWKSDREMEITTGVNNCNMHLTFIVIEFRLVLQPQGNKKGFTTMSFYLLEMCINFASQVKTCFVKEYIKGLQVFKIPRKLQTYTCTVF